ncbi:alpha-ketoacid dehydrogenase subunit beta [Miniimonas sp. S16]|uniref:alpha-ketoacid dehydrogenase subunit beta n=1 Tax=Miniimonas sp. S16 TaxID=2171623 RepID=UPI000D528614|nr:transketolase C-terminal domain-containing protein [Miniimonas sp. S16]
MTTTLPTPSGTTARTTQRLPLAKAINAGLRRALATNDRVLLMGEDIGRLGGVFRVTDGLQAEFGPLRVVDSPLAESGIVGTAIGLAMAGYRPVLEIQFDGFVFPAFDQITTQLSKMNARTLGRLPMPVVIRIPYGGHIGAVEHHSESPEALFAHTAGLRIVSPATAADGYTMIQQAIASPDPVIFLEPKARYWDKAEVDLSDDAAPDLGPDGWADLHRARTVRAGEDVTIVAYGPTVPVAVAAAQVAEQEGRSVEVIDLRSVSPIDVDAIVESVERTGRLVVVHEAPTFFGPSAEIAARVTERCFHHLEAPVLRVGAFHAPFPPTAVESEYLPSLDRLLDAVDRTFTF